jgi:hypothetical protein
MVLKNFSTSNRDALSSSLPTRAHQGAGERNNQRRLIGLRGGGRRFLLASCIGGVSANTPAAKASVTTHAPSDASDLRLIVSSESLSLVFSCSLRSECACERRDKCLHNAKKCPQKMRSAPIFVWQP